MQIYTLHVGQGQFVVVTGTTEAVIVDTYVPLRPETDIVYVKGALAKTLAGKHFIGLIVTGFDSDHFNEVGMKIVLNKYRPNWLMYPRYFKATSTADACFAVIDKFGAEKAIERYSMVLKANNLRLYKTISEDFEFEVFSPHSADMNSSNNCSIVCKITERATGRSYLVTGDTENDRWASIVDNFGDAIAADVLAAPHHGSRNGISAEALACIRPDTVLISAGVDNQYGHPHAESMKLFRSYTDRVYSTNWNGGQSLHTDVSKKGVATYKFEP